MKRVFSIICLCASGLAAAGQEAWTVQDCIAYALEHNRSLKQQYWSLRSDPRVVCLERTNARYLSHEIIPEEPDFASIDVSFISLKLILPAVASVLWQEGEVVCLIKPQFEAGREKVGKKGVVRDPAVHREVLERFLDHAKDSGFTVIDLTYSPIRGPEGNIEYLGHLRRGAWEERSFDLAALVAASHGALEEVGE